MPKVLIIRFSSIGDIVLTSPVVRCIKQQLEGAEIHFLTKSRFRDLVENNPHIAKVYSFNDHISEVIPSLREERYDHVIDLHKNLRSTLVKLKLPGRKSSFSKLNLEKWLMVNFKWNRLPEKHIVERYLDAAAELGVRNDGKGLEYHSTSDELPESLRNKGDFICVAIGANHHTKRMPPEMFVELLGKIGKPVIIIGGKGEADDGALMGKMTERSVNMCGELSLDESAAIVKAATLVITHDTGIMHMAAAFKKPIISIWGNTIPEFGMYPYMPGEPSLSHIFEVRDLNCRPCSKIGYDKCPKGHFRCMKDQDLDAIAGTALEIWDAQQIND